MLAIHGRSIIVFSPFSGADRAVVCLFTEYVRIPYVAQAGRSPSCFPLVPCCVLPARELPSVTQFFRIAARSGASCGSALVLILDTLPGRSFCSTPLAGRAKPAGRKFSLSVEATA
jgi:hypothetical protein